MKQQSFAFGTCIYPGLFVVTIGMNQRRALRALIKHCRHDQRYKGDVGAIINHLNESPFDSFGRSTNSGFVHLISLARLKRNDPSDVSCLAHECLHAAWDELDRRGVKVTADNDEALAYLQSFLVSETLRRLK